MHTPIFLPSQGFSTGIVHKIKALFYLLLSLIKVFRIIREHKATRVISVGGFSAAPCALCAIVLRVPLYIHEQNALLGRLNRVCRPFAKRLFCSFDLNVKEVTISGYPINNQFFDLAKSRKELRTIIFLGGSAGASFINNIALDIAPYLDDNGIRIIHQTGKRAYDEVKQAYDHLGIKVDILDFTSSPYEKNGTSRLCHQ